MTKDKNQVQAEEAMKGIAEVLKAAMPKDIGFSLFVFKLGEGGFITYASYCDRTDMIKVMREWLSHVED